MSKLMSDNEVHDHLHQQARALEKIVPATVAAATAVEAATKALDLLALALVAAGVRRDAR